MEALEQLGREKVYYDNTVDYHLIIARWTAFWKIYKEYDENKEIKDAYYREDLADIFSALSLLV